MDVHEPAVRRERARRRIGSHCEPGGEIAHQRWDLTRRREMMPTRVGEDKTALVGITAGDLRMRTLDDEAVQAAHIHFGQRSLLSRQVAHIAYGVVMVDGLQVVFKRLAADRNPFFDDECGLRGSERVAFDRIRSVGQLEVIDMLQVPKAARRQRAKPVQVGLLRRDLSSILAMPCEPKVN